MSFNIMNRIRKVLESISSEKMITQFEKSMLLSGRMKSDFNKINSEKYNSINDFEFSVFSQFGEDGIIQYLVNEIGIKNKTFVEFGVENYRESNTRFLLMNNNWSGLVIDGSENNITQIKESEIFWKYDLQARAAFITKENINEILRSENMAGEIGILSIDIDGNDYWVWENIDVVQPIIVIVEYNSVFGKNSTVTVQYDKAFVRHEKHYSGLYWGASLGAFIFLAERKGYSFVGCNSAGINAFFVRKDRVGDLKTLTLEEGYIESRFRDSRNEQGQLDFASGADRYKKIKGCTVFDVVQDKIITL